MVEMQSFGRLNKDLLECKFGKLQTDEIIITSVFMVKKLPETNLNVVVRVVLENDKKGLKNSVMSFYRIRKRNLEKLIQKNGLLYKKE